MIVADFEDVMKSQLKNSQNLVVDLINRVQLPITWKVEERHLKLQFEDIEKFTEHVLTNIQDVTKRQAVEVYDLIDDILHQNAVHNLGFLSFDILSENPEKYKREGYIATPKSRVLALDFLLKNNIVFCFNEMDRKITVSVFTYGEYVRLIHSLPWSALPQPPEMNLVFDKSILERVQDYLYGIAFEDMSSRDDLVISLDWKPGERDLKLNGHSLKTLKGEGKESGKYFKFLFEKLGNDDTVTLSDEDCEALGSNLQDVRNSLVQYMNLKGKDMQPLRDSFFQKKKKNELFFRRTITRAILKELGVEEGDLLSAVDRLKNLN